MTKDIIEEITEHIIDLQDARDDAHTIEATVGIDDALSLLARAQDHLTSAMQHDATALAQGLEPLEYDGFTGKAYQQYVGALT